MTSIEWTQETWNPVRGCKLVSPGCANCYAMKFAHRFSAPGKPYAGLTRLRAKGKGPVWTGEARFVREMLDVPRSWKKPTRVFVNSMSDLFHEDVSFEQIAAVFGVMAGCPQHIFQVLTKRPERMLAFFRWVESQEVSPTSLVEIMAANLCEVDQHNPPWPLPNVWLGVSVEDQDAADERIPLLLQVPAEVHFLSCEPLLERVDLHRFLKRGCACECVGRGPRCKGDWIRCNAGLRRPSWVIVGGESSHGARPFDLAWACSIRDQCKSAGVPFFFKQAGSRPILDGAPLKLVHHKGNDLQELPEDLRVREFPGGAS